MKLTKYIRQAFIEAAMNDVPYVDYGSQAQALAEKTLLEIMPASVTNLLSDKNAEPWINREYMYMPRNFSNFAGYTTRNNNDIISKLRPKVWGQINELHKLDEQQTEKLRQLRIKLQGCAESVTTRKALAELLPEFEKYLPEDQKEAIKTLPAVANIVADFAAAGWPKNKKASRVAA